MINKNKEAMDALGKIVTKFNTESDLRDKYSKILNNRSLEQKQSKSNKTRIIDFKFLIKAAAVVLILSSGLFFLQNEISQPTTHEFAQILLDKTTVFGNAEITRKEASEVNALRKKANQAYSKNEFKTSISLYETMRKNGILTDFDQYYLSVNYLRINDFHNAIKILSPLSQKDLTFSQEVNWFLSLSYILTLQDDKAKPILNSIVEHKSYKYKEAFRLLDKLNE